ncbi:MAG: archaellin/type IV pilin N-terminal domain-containing protein [Nitrososphaerales archaeon]
MRASSKKEGCNHRRKGLTGLETAIILIAFVIVASAFAFTVLNIGFQSTQKSQEVIAAGIEEASSVMEIDGAVIAKSNTTYLHNVSFIIKLSAGKSPVDLTQGKLAITWTSANKHEDNIYDGTKATVTPVFTSDTDMYLKYGDKYRVFINLKNDGVDDELRANAEFKIELKPPKGAVLTLSRRLPPALEPVMFLG